MLGCIPAYAGMNGEGRGNERGKGVGETAGMNWWVRAQHGEWCGMEEMFSPQRTQSDTE